MVSLVAPHRAKAATLRGGKSALKALQIPRHFLECIIDLNLWRSINWYVRSLNFDFLPYKAKTLMMDRPIKGGYP